jgi:hypothetical protein
MTVSGDGEDLPHRLAPFEMLVGQRRLRQRILPHLHLQPAALRPVEDLGERSLEVLEATLEIEATKRDVLLDDWPCVQSFRPVPGGMPDLG